MALSVFLGIFWLITSPVVSAQPCPEQFAQIAKPTYLARAKALPGKAYNLVLKNTVNDYREAWRDGPAVGRPYRLMRRFLFAPRVREADPVKREAALRKVQWLSALNEPVFDGLIEAASLLNVRAGEKLGIGLRPFERNLSIPGGMVVSGVTGYGTIAWVTDKVEETYFPSAEQQLERMEEKDKVGSRYLSGWEQLGILSPEQKLRAHNSQVNALKDWAENLNSKDPHRPLPPRLYQLRLEGMLKSTAEVMALETIALSSIREAKERVEGDPKVREDQETKRLIAEKLQARDEFKGRSPLEKKLLAMVLDPPVFMDGRVSNAWYSGAVEGDYESYKERRKLGDTYWLAQLVKNQKDPVLGKIREEFLKNPEKWDAPLLASYAALNFSPEAKLNLPALRQLLLRARSAEADSE